eukprot:6187140-Pleurochrysis_carterae.AAC.1
MQEGGCIGSIVVRGCTNSRALNYDSTANVLSSCTYAIRGCTDSTAENYIPAANVEDGTCAFWAANQTAGCMDSTNLCYNSSATYNDGNRCFESQCIRRLGCTNSNAVNYNSLANVDSGEGRAVATTR